MIYNYKLGRKRVEKILKNNLKVIDKKKLPNPDVLTFGNSYYSWIASIFVDMRNSSSLFKNEDAKKVSKIMMKSLYLVWEFFLNLFGKKQMKIQRIKYLKF